MTPTRLRDAGLLTLGAVYGVFIAHTPGWWDLLVMGAFFISLVVYLLLTERYRYIDYR